MIVQIAGLHPQALELIDLTALFDRVIPMGKKSSSKSKPKPAPKPKGNSTKY
jgi:hypothetical protein